MLDRVRRLFGSHAALRVGDVVLSLDDDLQSHREKLARVVLDGMYQFVGLLSADGMTLEINRAALDGAGVDMHSIRGKPFWEARWFQVSREVTETLRDFVQRARGGEFIRCDLEVYGRASGEATIIVDFSLLPVRDARGDVVFLLAEGRDITEKKRAEAEVARKTAELQGLLERIRKLDQLKSDLFANVSHELRTPLTLILGPVDEMLEHATGLGEEQRRHLEVVRRNAVVLLKHVNDLLDLSKIDARKMALRCERCDLAAIVRLVGEQFHALAPQRSLTYVVETPPTMPAQVDPEKLERVVLNLLSNAFKFTPDGGRIRLSLQPLPEARALLSVQDSGPGIDKEMHSAVFERFRQLQAGTTRNHAGTGLGLAIAKEFVELHSGTIGVIDAPGGGSLFQVEIPLQACGEGTLALPGPQELASPADVAGTLAELALAVGAEGTTAGRRGHAGCAVLDGVPQRDDDRALVLVVEDNAEMRRFVAHALASEHHVAEVADGEQAEATALRLQPDLVVTDLMLPRLGGDRLIERLRGHPPLRDTPVLVLSAKQDETLRARLLAGLAQDYVTKPFSAHELRARVRNLATMKRARDALRRELASQTNDLSLLARELIGSRRALQESEHRWATMFQHSPVGILLAEEGGRIRAANPAFCGMLQYDEDELCGLTLERITPVEDRAAARARVGALLQGSLGQYHLQRRFQRKDQVLVWANTSVAYVSDQGDGERFLIVVADDISERRRAEEALHRVQSELARVTRASTLGELAASIAHEVNQPLAAIVANGHACLRWLDAEPADDGEARSAVQRIIRDANRASQVIARIRNFLKPGQLQREPMHLAEVIAEVLGLVRKEAESAAALLRFEAGAGLPQVVGDRVQIQQVVLNLVINAIEAVSAQGSGRRVVDLGVRALPDGAVRVDVRDSGAGIDPACSETIFEAFHTTKPGGMGMGLAISRSIVESHGGRLWVACGQGSGAEFSFVLPGEPLRM